MKTISRYKLLLIILVFVQINFRAFGDSISFEYDGENITSFEARGVSYEDIYKLAAAFCGLKEELVSAPLRKLNIRKKDTTWIEIMILLKDPEIWIIENRGKNKIAVMDR